MSRSRWATRPVGRLVIAAAIAGLAVGVAACDAGNNAPTLEFHPQSAGLDTEVHGINVINAFALAAPSGSPNTTESAGVFLALSNTGPKFDKLVSASATSAATSVQIPHGGVALPSQQTVYLVGPTPKILLKGLLEPLAPGGTVRVTLTFQNAGSVTLTLPVLPPTGEYATFSPAPTPAASPTTTSPISTGGTDRPVTSSPSTSATSTP